MIWLQGLDHIIVQDRGDFTAGRWLLPILSCVNHLRATQACHAIHVVIKPPVPWTLQSDFYNKKKLNSTLFGLCGIVYHFKCNANSSVPHNASSWRLYVGSVLTPCAPCMTCCCCCSSYSTCTTCTACIAYTACTTYTTCTAPTPACTQLPWLAGPWPCLPRPVQPEL